MPNLKTLLLGLLIATPLAIQAQDNAPTPADEASAATMNSGGRIARSLFTTGIIDREPADNITELTTADNRVFYYTVLLGMEGQTVAHRWTHNGEVMAEVSFNVGGPRWRVWSSKGLVAGWTGDWAVSVVNAAGEILGGNRFSYLPVNQ